MGSERERHHLDHDDIRSGMALMQTVYTVAMVLGLQQVVESSYRLLDASVLAEWAAFDLAYLSLVYVSVVLLSIRFFWVPRNLNSFVVQFFDELGEEVFTRVTTIHFPIAMIHALLFYYLCQTVAEMTDRHAAWVSDGVSEEALWFVGGYTVLLLLNAGWLLRITPRGGERPQAGDIWWQNNLFFALLAVLLLVLHWTFTLPWAFLIPLACAFFILNSVLDLSKASRFYILYEDRDRSEAHAAVLGCPLVARPEQGQVQASD